MFNDFYIKIDKEDNWTLKYLHVYHGIFIAESENEYKKGKKISFSENPEFSFTKESKSGEEYHVLTISSKEHTVHIRSLQRLSLEYIIYNSEQEHEKDMGRPMTFVPHLINVDSVLYYTRRHNFEFKGIINLVVVALILSHLRLMYDNIVKSGLQLNVGSFLSLLNLNNTYILAICGGLTIICILNAFIIEKIAPMINNMLLTNCMNFCNFALLLSCPVIIKKLGYFDPIASNFGLFVLVIVFLKLYSYAHFWMDVRKYVFKRNKLREQEKNRKKASVNKGEIIARQSVVKKEDILKLSMYEEMEAIIENYPKNVCFFSLFEFLFMPVLCFQFQFPRTKRVRLYYLLNFGSKIIIATFIQ